MADPKLYLVGTKGRVQLQRRYPPAAFWPLLSKSFGELAKEVAIQGERRFLVGGGRFGDARVEPFRLDHGAAADARSNCCRSRPRAAEKRDAGKNSFEFEPDVAAVLASLLPKYLEFTIFQALLETQASEFAARLIAMTSATDNAGKLIDEITMLMNQTRQAAITKEILEIVGGAEALKG